MSSNNTLRRRGALCGLLAGLLLTTAAVAQSRVARELDLGVTGGVVMSQMNFQPTISQDMARGYTVGVSARYIEEKFFGLQIDALLTRRGFKDRYTDYPNYNFRRNLTYLEVPALTHVYFAAGRKNEIFFDLGPKFGMMLWESTDSTLPADFGQSGTPTAGYETAHHDMKVANRFDYGIQAGIGYEFKFSKEVSLQLKGSYYFGLGNIFPDTKADTFETSANRSVLITTTLFWHRFLDKAK